MIRPATGQDARAIAKLWTVAYLEEGEGGRATPYAEADFFETARNARVTVAVLEGRVIGVVALLAPGAPGRAVAHPDEAELSRLAVDPTARRRGVGRLLAKECETVARGEEWEAIALWSRAYQDAAHRLYESLGYQRIPDRDTVDETRYQRLVFRLDL